MPMGKERGGATLERSTTTESPMEWVHWNTSSWTGRNWAIFAVKICWSGRHFRGKKQNTMLCKYWKKLLRRDGRFCHATNVKLLKRIVGLIIKPSSDPQALGAKKVYLTKLNMFLVQILKCEWPKNWESFIGDIVGAPKTRDDSLCQKNMQILKLLSEEVFNFCFYTALCVELVRKYMIFVFMLRCALSE